MLSGHAVSYSIDTDTQMFSFYSASALPAMQTAVIATRDLSVCLSVTFR